MKDERWTMKDEKKIEYEEERRKKKKKRLINQITKKQPK